MYRLTKKKTLLESIFSEIFYVRNHLPVPEVDPETYELELEVEGTDKTLTFTLEDLKKFPKHTTSAAIMCAGNRRSDMGQVLIFLQYCFCVVSLKINAIIV